MSEVSPVSEFQLRERRLSLRRRRRVKTVQNLWQGWAMITLTLGVFWGISQPLWLIRSAAQIQPQGNEILSDQAIRSLVALDYPQPLLKVKPDQIAQQIQQSAPVVEVRVSRQLLPPRLSIQVQERRPVAQVLPGTSSTDATQPGLLDADGVWLSKSDFTQLDQSPQLPDLVVRGMRSQHQAHWPEIYRAIEHSPVAIQEIDWRNPSDLVLRTELGMVYLGPYSYRFPEQLAALDRLRNLSAQVDPQQLAYIDLSNPSSPSVQFSMGDPP